ncbi:tetratricopeptide repeat protein [Candidatus Omnitrophota bacterium]
MWDDKDLIVENRYVKQLKYIPYLFTYSYWRYHHPGTKGLYRPITTTSFSLDYSLWKLNPFGYHLSNLILHIINVILIYFLGLKLVGKRAGLLTIPFLSALFFAVHPIHTESVTWIKNRADLLALLFFLAALLLFIKHLQNSRRLTLVYGLSVFCYVLALSAKVLAVPLPLVLLAYVLCFLPKSEYKPGLIKTVPFFVILVLYLVYKLTASAGAPGAALSPIAHVSIVFKTIGYYLQLLILPINLNAERLLTIPQSLVAPSVLLSIAAITIVFSLIIKTFKSNKLACFGLLWVLLTLGPVSNILYLSSRPIAEQRLYIPSLGFCLLLAWLLKRLVNSRLAGALILAITVFYSTTAIQRNRDWRDSLTFWIKTVQASPLSARAHNNLGNAYSDLTQREEAIASYQQAIAINPVYAGAYYNLGNEHYYLDRSKEAIAFFNQAIKFEPQRKPDVYNNLAAAYQTLGQDSKAKGLYEQAIELDADYAQSYVNLGLLYLQAGKSNQALALFERAVAIDPRYPEAYNNLGVAQEHQGQLDQARQAYQTAAQIDSDYADAYYNLAILEVTTGRTEQAVTLFEQAIAVNPKHASAYYNLGIVYKNSARPIEAIAMFEKSIAIQPQADAYNSLGEVYAALGEREQARVQFKRALELQPDYQKALDNLGLITGEESSEPAN